MGVSTHVLDTHAGAPARGIAVTISRSMGDAWDEIGRAATDADGRCPELLQAGEVLRAGVYCIRFEIAAYFAKTSERGLYPFVEIAFEAVAGQTHYHIPLLISANGYTTYRGS